jgi:hypothetical protein
VYKTIKMPTKSKYKPELDKTPTLGDKEANYYQSLIGVLQWIVELGRIDIAFEVSTLAQHSAAPQEGHMRNVLHVFGYLKTHMRFRLVLDHRKRDLSSMQWTNYDWHCYYPDTKETICITNPPPRGKSVQVSFFVDASFASDAVTRKSTTGLIIFVNGAPIDWMSKQQARVETSAYGA